MFLAALMLVSAGIAHALPAWVPYGPDGGDARRFAADPSDHLHLYLGTATGWIYESHNAGKSWRRLSLIGKRDDLVLDSIVVDPTNPKHLLVGAWTVDGPAGGLYISYDGGSSWISQAEMRGQSIRALTMAPSDPRILVAGTLKGVFRSVDGGRRWKQISPVDSTEIHEVESIAIDPKDPNAIYAGTWHLPWKTTDAGATWSNIKNGIITDSDVFSIIIDPDTPNTVYASACSGIYKSLDAGEVFTKVQGIPAGARRTRVLMQDPTHLSTVFAGTTEGLFRSNDAGRLWTRTTSQEVIVNDVYVEAADPRHVLIATDRGGVLSSEDGGDTFGPSNGGFSARQVTSVRHDRAHPATLYAGVVNDKEWGGVFESQNGGVNWTQRADGLAGRDVFSLGQAPDGTVIAGTSHGIYLLDTAAETWRRVETVPKSTADRPEPIAVAVAEPLRAPVPIGRNHFAERVAPRVVRRQPQRPAPVPARRSHAAAATHIIPARTKAKRGAAGRPVVIKARKGVTAKAGRPARAVIRRAKPAPAPRLSPAASQIALPVTARLPIPAERPAEPAVPPAFDGSIYGLATVGDDVLAITSEGLLLSGDNGRSWQPGGPAGSADWRLIASAKNNIVAASLHGINLSTDGGKNWSPIPLPEELTLVAAIAVEPAGELWVGGREGVFTSEDRGQTWTTPKNLFVPAVNSIFYDEEKDRILVTAASPNRLVFLVQLPQKVVTYVDSGWGMRFVRPVGDHLIAVTPFDGIVIQPKMVPTPAQTREAAAR